MKEEHRALLKSVRDKAVDLGAEMKKANDIGFTVTLNIDNVTGGLIKFEVSQRTVVDIDAPATKTH